LTAAALFVGGLAAPPAAADEISSLRGKSPNLPDFGDIVANRSNLRILGKALFWDATVGSDGFACATCHFHAGADIRIDNQFNPGGKDSNTFEFDHDHEVNQTATADQFPFFRLDPNTPLNESELRNPDNVILDGDDRFSSNGTFEGNFIANQNLEDQSFDDDCEIQIGQIHSNFQIQGNNGEGTLATRKVEPRQTPTVVNAVFNFRQFWDGRANNIFNGVDPFGERTNKAGIGGVLKLENGQIEREILKIRHASLASQAVGPVLSTFEMSCADRPFAFVGRKILSQIALEKQKVDPTDSVFRTSGVVNTGGNGLTVNYAALVQAAFNPKYWDDDRPLHVVRDYDPNSGTGNFEILEPGDANYNPDLGFTLIEQNFPLFWGLALHEYQASLISDASDFDRNRLSAAARRGKSVFENEGKCTACHDGPLLSGAAITDQDNDVLIEAMFLATEIGNQGSEQFAALYDGSFYNIGVSPTSEDLGLGDVDPYGNPLSFTRQANSGNIVDERILDKNNDGQITVADDVVTIEDANELVNPDGTFLGSRDAVDGAFKTPILRNVGTTPPYMHDGSLANLDQVIEFYNRGGNRLRTPNDSSTEDTTGFGPNDRNLDADIGVLDLTEQQKSDLKAFMLSLTDSRVLCHRAPFDHPELDMYLGHEGAINAERGAPRAEDVEKVLPAVGARGYSRSKCLPNTGDLFGEMQAKFNALLEDDN
jgi:cytochrome c peroxidase